MAETLAIVTPVLNDWPSLDKLLSVLAEDAALAAFEIHVFAVDDGSPETATPSAPLSGPLASINVIRLKANLGHQRAIAIGLAHVLEQAIATRVVVMDSDGEDRPEDVARLIRASAEKPGTIIVAQRRRRSESLLFKVFYQAYKFIFRYLTGKTISFGNFSLIPRARLSNVVYNDSIWNNYAATLLRSRVPIAFVETDRGKRYFGVSTMNFTALLLHGMSAIATFSEIVIGRIVTLLVGVAVFFVALIAAVVVMRTALGFFIPGYATNLILFLANMLLNSLLLGVLLILTLLASRNQRAASPTEIARDMIARVDRRERARAPA